MLISTKRNTFSFLINFALVGIFKKSFIYFLHNITNCSSRKTRKYEQVGEQVLYPHRYLISGATCQRLNVGPLSLHSWIHLG